MTTYNGTAVAGTPGASGTTPSGTNENAIEATQNDGSGQSAVFAYLAATTGAGSAVFAKCVSAAGCAVHANNAATAGTGTGTGLYATTAQSDGNAVYALHTKANGYAIEGIANVSGGTGIYGEGGASGGSIGVWGTCSDGSGWGGYFSNDLSAGAIGAYSEGYDYGLYCHSTNANWALYAAGNAKITSNLTVTGSITAGTKDFKIDHPLDPANKYLSHSCVESPDRKNVYDGVVDTDAHGDAMVVLPAYFEALNGDFRYQLTAIGKPAPDLHIKAELASGRFLIGGAQPKQRVSWQITGIRRDAHAKANRLVVEEAKSAEHQGRYLHPEAHGQPAEKCIEHPTTDRVRKNAARMRSRMAAHKGAQAGGHPRGAKTDSVPAK